LSIPDEFMKLILDTCSILHFNLRLAIVAATKMCNFQKLISYVVVNSVVDRDRSIFLFSVKNEKNFVVDEAYFCHCW